MLEVSLIMAGKTEIPCDSCKWRKFCQMKVTLESIGKLDQVSRICKEAPVIKKRKKKKKKNPKVQRVPNSPTREEAHIVTLVKKAQTENLGYDR